MSAEYPTDLATFVDPALAETLSDMCGGLGHKDSTIKIHEEIAALQAKVGIDSSAVAGTIDKRMQLYDVQIIDIYDTYATKAGVETLTNKTLTSPKLNEDVALTPTATELNLLHDNLGAWADWTPAIIGSGAMTVTSDVIQYARYLVIGKICFFEIGATFTTGGTAGNYVVFEMPPGITSRNGGASIYPAFPTFIHEGATLLYKSGLGFMTDVNFLVGRYDGTVWALKAASKAYLSGHFEIA